MDAWQTEMLQHTHEYVQNQITLGDAKAAGILAWDAALVAWLAEMLSPQPSFGVLLGMLLATGGLLILSVVFSAFALMPRTPSASPENRVSFVDIACRRADYYRKQMMGGSEADCCEDLCEHIHVLGGIAAAKFGHVRVAVILSAMASGLLILSLLM